MPVLNDWPVSAITGGDIITMIHKPGSAMGRALFFFPNGLLSRATIGMRDAIFRRPFRKAEIEWNRENQRRTIRAAVACL